MAEVMIYAERVDDIPLLVRQQQKMGIAEIIDEVVKQHGNRDGLSVGWMIVGWLTFILSESDHRLSFVENWATDHLMTLNGVIGQPVASKDFTDDRLGDGLRILSDDEVWEKVEAQLGSRLVQVYELPTETARVDTTTVSGYHDPEGSELFAYGLSKDHRPDLAQVKVLSVALDPLALPVVTLVLAGNRADDGLYIPAINLARQTLQRKGLLYVGDSKMEALATRAQLAQAGDYYLMPLSHKGEQAKLLAEQVAFVLTEQIELDSVYSLAKVDGQEAKLLAQGWETVRMQEAVIEAETVHWSERRLLIYSPALAQSGYRGFQQRLAQAEAKLADLTPSPGRGKRQWTELDSLQAEVEAILSTHRVAEFLQAGYHPEVQQRHIRRYGNRPARTETITRYQVIVTRNDPAIQAAYRTMGWRLYATNAPPERLSLADAVRTYRGGVPTIERDYARLKGRSLGLRPVFVQRDDHVKGLVRLLTLALCILTLTEFVVRRSLQEEGESLVGLYPGNPTRATSWPTTERLLRAFKGLTLSIVDLPGQRIQHATPLTPLQNRILQLLRFTDSTYTDLAQVRPIPP